MRNVSSDPHENSITSKASGVAYGERGHGHRGRNKKGDGVNVMGLPKNIASFVCACPVRACVYNGEKRLGYCENPRINSGNGDAACHKMTAEQVTSMLSPLKIRHSWTWHGRGMKCTRCGATKAGGEIYHGDCRDTSNDK